MEKISIVRRRKEGAFEPGAEQHLRMGPHSLHGQELIEIPSNMLNQISSI